MTENKKSLAGITIAVIAPAPLQGSGELVTIFNRLRTLQTSGAQCDVYFQGSTDLTAYQLKSSTEAYYGSHSFGLYQTQTPQKYYDLLIATNIESARIVRDAEATHKVYLLQDFESLSVPVSSECLLGEESYLYGFIPVTHGSWLARKLKLEFGVDSFIIPFSADRTIYSPLKLERKKAVCLIDQPEKPRCCSQTAHDALAIVKEHAPDVEIILYGSNSTLHPSFQHTNLGILGTSDCNRLYNECQVGLSISTSNPSRVPFEMMASGLPVVDLYRQNNLFDIPDNGALLAHQTPESIAEAILLLLQDEDLRENLSKGGIAFMQNFDSENEEEACLSAITKVISGDAPRTPWEAFQHSYRRAPVVAPEYQSEEIRHHCGFHAGRVLDPNNWLFNDTIKLELSEPASSSFAKGLLDLALPTTAQPHSVDFDIFRIEQGNYVLTHPYSTSISAGVLPRAFKAGAKVVKATVVLAHEKAAPTECAIALVAAGTSVNGQSQTSLTDLFESSAASGWVSLAPMVPIVLSITAENGFAHDCDIHFGARPHGEDFRHASCRWISFEIK